MKLLRHVLRGAPEEDVLDHLLLRFECANLPQIIIFELEVGAELLCPLHPLLSEPVAGRAAVLGGDLDSGLIRHRICPLRLVMLHVLHQIQRELRGHVGTLYRILCHISDDLAQ